MGSFSHGLRSFTKNIANLKTQGIFLDEKAAVLVYIMLMKLCAHAVGHLWLFIHPAGIIHVVFHKGGIIVYY